MGAMARQRVSQSLKALLDHDATLAKVVREGDGEIDEMELDIDEECLKILALQGPVAGDLRYVLAILRINQKACSAVLDDPRRDRPDRRTCRRMTARRRSRASSAG